MRYNEADEKNYHIARPLSKLCLITTTEAPFFTPAPAWVFHRMNILLNQLDWD